MIYISSHLFLNLIFYEFDDAIKLINRREVDALEISNDHLKYIRSYQILLSIDI